MAEANCNYQELKNEMHRKRKELECINNVREWMRKYSPEEWQIDGIDKDLTFDWLIDHIHEPNLCDLMIDMDTAPRESILSEAIRRAISRISKSGFCKWAVKEMLEQFEDWK